MTDDVYAPPVPPVPRWQPSPAARALQELWAAPPSPLPLPTWVFVAAVALAAAASAGERPGLAVTLTLCGLVAVAVAAGALRGVLAVALALVPLVRDSGLVVGLAVVAALLAGTFAVVRPRTPLALLLAPFTPLLALPRVVPAIRLLRRRLDAGGGRRYAPVLRAGLLTAAVLLVFGPLLVSADALFGDAVLSVLPSPDAGLLTGRFLLAALAMAAALVVGLTAAAPPRWDDLAVRPPSGRARLEWLVPVVALDLLLAGFVAVQGIAALGGADEVLRSGGVTYADRAREGFGQLLACTVLVVLVVAVTVMCAARDSRRDRVLLRTALGALCLLSLCVAAVALTRLGHYQQAYGWTRARVFAAGAEAYVVTVLVLLIAAGVRLRTAFLPRALAGAAAFLVLLAAVVDLDGFVAERNVDRYAVTGDLDIHYLGSLSADAVPALDRLPEPLRSCALGPIALGLGSGDGLGGINLSRVRAREVLAGQQFPTPWSSLCSGQG